MRVGLLNWSGHSNIGDDVMTSCIQKALEDRGHTVINQGENPDPTGIDAYFWGGGTLISANGVFPRIPDVPTIGFGIGVCEAPPSIFVKEELKNIKHIFARDIYSYLWLCSNKIPTTLSFDPVFLLDTPISPYNRSGVAVNIIASPKTDYAYVKQLLNKYENLPKFGFSVGLPEDPVGCMDFNIPCTHFSDPTELIHFLHTMKVAITTRLHATVFAYMAGVPTIEPVVYDPKVKRFMEYVVDNKLSHEFMRERLNEHIDYALSLLKS